MSTRTEFNRSLYDSNGRNGNKAVSQVPAYVMGSMLVGSGIAHLVVPAKFDWMMPAELPGGQRFYTTASGVMEIATGAMILVPKARSVGALWAVVVFIGVFPANLNGVRLWWHKPWRTRLVPILRLPLQIPLVMTALRIRRNARGGRYRSSR